MKLLAADNLKKKLRPKILIVKKLSKEQRTSLLTFLLLLIALPIVSIATYNAVRYRSKANYPTTPPVTPITPPNLTPTPPSFKTVFNEAIYLDNMTSYPSWSWNYVKIARFEVHESSTFEAWIKLERDIQGNNSIIFKEEGFNFAVEGDGKGMNKLFFGSSEYGGANSDGSNQESLIEKGKWHHVAIVRNSETKTTKLFLNGKNVTREDANYYKHGEDYRGTVVVGAAFQQAYSQPSAGLPATIDEVRISNIARYDSDFEKPILPFEIDEYTQLLYHFDANFEEASGDPSKAGQPNDDDDVKFIVSYPLSYPKPYEEKPIAWQTETVSLRADDFYITVNGEVFQPRGDVRISSNPGNSNYTTLETIWNEQGKEIKLHIDFHTSENPYSAYWWVFEISTSTDNVPGNKIYYKDLYTYPVMRQNLNTPLKASPHINIFSNPRPINNYFGKIYFKNLELLPTFNQDPKDRPVVNFKLKFQGINQQRKDHGIDLHLFKDDQKYKTLKSIFAYPDKSGVYHARTLIDLGTYDIYVKGWTHLQKKFENITIIEGENNIDLTNQEILSGNAIDGASENYGVINIIDFSILARDYNKTKSPADFNESGLVDIIDFSILATNYGKEGDKLP